MNGYDSERFDSYDTLTREQLATVMYQFAKYRGVEVSARADLSRYTDSKQVDSWALEAMSWANAIGLINGTSGTTLSPLNPVKCCELASILMNYDLRYPQSTRES